MRMFFGDFDAEQSSRTADIAQAAIAREIEFVGERFEVDARQAGHPVEKAFELFRVGIQFIEYVFAAVLGFVLRFPGSQRFRQIIPILEQPRIEHLRDSTDVARAAAVEIESGGGRVEIFRVGAVALTFEEFHCHERIEKICDAARMQVKFLADLSACEPSLTECAEEIERDRSQQDLGIPEAECSLQNCVGCERRCLHTVVDVANLSGVTSDGAMRKRKLIACALLRVESGEGSANWRGRNVQNMRPITWMARLILVTCYQ